MSTPASAAAIPAIGRISQTDRWNPVHPSKSPTAPTSSFWFANWFDANQPAMYAPIA